MKVAIAIDSFKGSLSSLQAGNAAAQGIHRVDPDVKTVVRTLADGGEGTVQALTEGLGGQFVSVPVTGPAQKTVSCTYGVIEQAQTAVIEMSGAAGITLVSDTERNPLYTTTYGVGEVIQDAVLRGCRHFIIGIGGSATNDGGIGMLSRHSVSDCSMQKENRFLLVPSGWNLLPRLRQITFCRNFRNAPSVLPAM
ncbi:MAG: glycerate kinase [Mediterraneibacter gnavus]